ncbi:MAG: hypothetical protein H6719_10820 [Sandaracinaceae bacterium]|nr:hypothetical protein [Sandaracinaceae bacterium]
MIAAIGMAAGCGESHDGGTDAAITFDAAFADAGPSGGDAGVPPSNVGAACREDMDCDGTDAYCDAEYPGGYCTGVCAEDQPCPEGGVCLESMAGATCYGGCDFDAADGDFCPRDGYGCADMLGVCLPGCDTDAECATGLVCDTTGGFYGEGACANPDAHLGDACTDETECPPGTTCFSERFTGIPGGACGSFGCDPTTGDGCPDNGTCVSTGRRGGICLLACEADTDCTRDGQSCTDSPNGGYCGPSFVPANLGQVCSAGRGSCTGGACLSEGMTGWPDSYCVAVGCDLTDGSGCPDGGVCMADSDGDAICVLGCTGASDCRDGYDCAPVDSSDPSSATACLPGCDDSTVCGNMGFTCNPGTGLCTEGFDAANLGEPCSNAGDCPGGLCLSEPASGWPAGTCTFPGCRLTGTGMEPACAMGSTCVDDGAGDPELGVCVDACTAPTDCRPGYDCTGGACVPACSAADCGMGRTCNTTSGLCE